MKCIPKGAINSTEKSAKINHHCSDCPISCIICTTKNNKKHQAIIDQLIANSRNKIIFKTKIFLGKVILKKNIEKIEKGMV